MTSTQLIQHRVDDLIRQRAKECRRLASAAQNAGDKMLWLGLVERWHAVESRSAQQHCLGQGPLVDQPQKHSLSRAGKSAGASPARNSQQLSSVR
jgi:hypothetical protein